MLVVAPTPIIAVIVASTPHHRCHCCHAFFQQQLICNAVTESLICNAFTESLQCNLLLQCCHCNAMLSKSSTSDHGNLCCCHCEHTANPICTLQHKRNPTLSEHLPWIDWVRIKLTNANCCINGNLLPTIIILPEISLQLCNACMAVLNTMQANKRLSKPNKCGDAQIVCHHLLSKLKGVSAILANALSS